MCEPLGYYAALRLLEPSEGGVSFKPMTTALAVDGSRLEASLRQVAVVMPRLLKLLRYSPQSMTTATRLYRTFVTIVEFTPSESLRG